MSGFSPTIGRIDGINIELHWTFIVLLIFILFLSLYFFVLWILLFACVLVHELVHSITSKRNNIKVKKIVLYPFGGGSIIDFEKVKPDIEFRISIVGPIASLLLAMLFGILTLFTPAGMIEITVQTLFILNVFLGVFNLLPWLPLDGGRALRSYLQKTRSFLDATKIAAKSSNVVTVLFILGTIAYAFFAPNYSILYREIIVLWDVAIAFFIYNGSQAELQSAIIKDKVSDLRAIDAVTKNYMMVKPDTTIDELYKIFIKGKENIVLFQKDKRIYTISNVSLQKLLKNSSTESKIEQLGVEIPSINYNLSLYNAIERMRSDERSIAAVIKGNKIEGILLMPHIEAIIALHVSKKSKKSQDVQRNK